MVFETKITGLLVDASGLDTSEVSSLLSVPPDRKRGDFAFPCFKLGGNVVEKAREIADKIVLSGFLEKIEAVGPYVNFYVKSRAIAQEVLGDIATQGAQYGASGTGDGKTIVLDYSAPNIAKPFGIGHLRSTIIGQSLRNVFDYLGYKTVGVNHIGDWGTQFGKLIVAFTKWGDRAQLEKDPINYLLELYVRFNNEAEKDDSLNDAARAAFKNLEDGGKEEHLLWKEFRDLSLREFQRVYDLLGVTFDSWNGEAFYNDKMQAAIERLQSKSPTEISEGALVFNLEKQTMPPVLLRKSNGATTYHTRDLATAYYRLDEYNPDKFVYVVGSPQKLHFRQLFTMLGCAGFDTAKFIHVDFGLIMLADGSKMSTRKGNIILLDEVLTRSIDLAAKIIEEKNPGLEQKDVVAKQVGLGAVIFNDLSSDRIRNINFDWDKMLSFEGETGPYLQYTHARACSILRKMERSGDVDYALLVEEKEKALLSLLSEFGVKVSDAATHYKPHIICRYLLDLAQAFNEFYHAHKVIGEDEGLSKARLALVDGVRQVLCNGLGLLGIGAPERM